MKVSVAITGYASLDHVAMLDAAPRPGRTSTILARPDGAWPRLGGSPAYVAAALAAAGVEGALPVSWIGDDDAGDRYVDGLRALRIPVAGLARVTGARTPIAILAYDPDGGCACLYDPGMPRPLTLTDVQHNLVSAADWLCVTIGPRDATAAALDALRPDARVAWVVKDDPRALPPDLARRLGARADLVCHSRAERAFVEAALCGAGAGRPGRIVIETRGAEGAVATRCGVSVTVATWPLETPDPTGAGDTFAGGVLAALAGGSSDLAAAVAAGHAAAARLLGGRRDPRNESA